MDSDLTAITSLCSQPVNLPQDKFSMREKRHQNALNDANEVIASFRIDARSPFLVAQLPQASDTRFAFSDMAVCGFKSVFFTAQFVHNSVSQS
jgi:hypothetical protein